MAAPATICAVATPTSACDARSVGAETKAAGSVFEAANLSLVASVQKASFAAGARGMNAYSVTRGIGKFSFWFGRPNEPAPLQVRREKATSDLPSTLI